MKVPEIVHVHVIPAEAGWGEARFTAPDDAAPSLYYEPIVGWRVETYFDNNKDLCSSIVALTVEGEVRNPQILRSPNGRLRNYFTGDITEDEALWVLMRGIPRSTDDTPSTA